MPGAGRRRPNRTETLLSALRRPRLPVPRALATAGKAAEPADFSRVRGALRSAHGTRTAVGHAAAPGPPQGDGARAASSVRRRRLIWRAGARVWRPRAADGSPPPRPASGAPASAPLFPPALKAPGAERPRESSAGCGALAAPPGARRRRAGAGDAGTRPHKPRGTLQRRNRSAE